MDFLPEANEQSTAATITGGLGLVLSIFAAVFLLTSIFSFCP